MQTLEAAPCFACIKEQFANKQRPSLYAMHLYTQLVFTEVALGAVVLTVNVVLLGGDIVFFQSMV